MLLVKPQFELDADQIEAGGVVRDPALRAEAAERVAAAARTLGYEVLGLTDSTLPGAKGGNVELLLYARLRRTSET